MGGAMGGACSMQGRSEQCKHHDGPKTSSEGVSWENYS